MHKKTLAALAATTALALGAAACGGSDEDTASAPAAAATTEAAPAATPVAEIPTLTGKDTAVTLDAGFVDRLGDLKLTPARSATRRSARPASPRFPITGGNVTYYKPGTVSPYVQGEIDHDGAGLSLTGGGKTVELTDFVVDPGASVLTGKVTVDGKEAAAERPAVLPRRPHAEAARGRRRRHRHPRGHHGQAQAGGGRPAQPDLRRDALKGGLVIGVAKITVNTAA